MKLYRFEDGFYGDRVRIEEREFEVIKETPCGYWMEYYNEAGKKWVSNSGLKRFAYPDRGQAMINFKARKNRQIQILSGQLQRAKNALAFVDNDFPEFKNIKPKRRRDMGSLWEGWD